MTDRIVSETNQEHTPLDAPWWPNHLVIGWFEKKKEADAVLRQIEADEVAPQQVYLFRGATAARRLAKSREGSIFLRCIRLLWRGTFIDYLRLRDIEDTARTGGWVVVVQANDDASADEFGHDLATYGGHEVTRFSRSEGVEVIGPRA